MAIAKPSSPRVSAVAGPRSGGNPTWRAFSSTSFQRFLGLLLGLGLGLVYHLLLLLPLVLVVDGLLVGRYRPLVREAVEDTEGQGGPPENVDTGRDHDCGLRMNRVGGLLRGKE